MLMAPGRAVRLGPGDLELVGRGPGDAGAGGLRAAGVDQGGLPAPGGRGVRCGRGHPHRVAPALRDSRRRGPRPPASGSEGTVQADRGEASGDRLGLRHDGPTQARVARPAGVSKKTAFRALAAAVPPPAAPVVEAPALVPLARPTPRQAERQAARAGVLAGASRRSPRGVVAARRCPARPAGLAATGLKMRHRGLPTTRAAYYGLPSLVL